MSSLLPLAPALWPAQTLAATGMHRFRLLLATVAAACVLLLAASTGSGVHASALGDTAPSASPSSRPVHLPLLSSLRSYEVVAIDSGALQRDHSHSIVLGAQPSSNPNAVRQFAKRVAFRFQTESVHRTETAAGADAEAASASGSSSPRLFDYTLSKTEDLFGPNYKQTRQVWRNGVRFEDEETVTRQCLHRETC